LTWFGWNYWRTASFYNKLKYFCGVTTLIKHNIHYHRGSACAPHHYRPANRCIKQQWHFSAVYNFCEHVLSGMAYKRALQKADASTYLAGSAAPAPRQKLRDARCWQETAQHAWPLLLTSPASRLLAAQKRKRYTRRRCCWRLSHKDARLGLAHHSLS